MQKKIFLHAGHFKTATSTLQKILSDNRNELQNAGIDYPQTGKKFPLQHGEVLLDYARSRNTSASLVKYLEAFQGGPAQTLILSAEAVSNLSAVEMLKLLGKLKHYGQLKVVYMVRSWASYLPSRYQQNVRVCDAWTWWEYLSACEQEFNRLSDINYALNIKLLASCEPETFNLLYYRPQTAVKDLLVALGVGHIVKAQFPAINRGLHSEVVEVIRLLNEADLLAKKMGRSLRFDTLLQNVDLDVSPLQNARKAQRLLSDSFLGDDLRKIIVNTQDSVEPICPIITEMWTNELSAVVKRLGLTEPPSSWLSYDFPEYHRPSNLTFNDLPKELRVQILEM